MQDRQANRNREEGNIGPLEAYRILLERQLNEDRRVLNFSAVFLTAHSFLFLGFVMLSDSNSDTPFGILRIILACAGILLAICLLHLNLSATNALRFWHSAQQKIEETAPEFYYMYSNKITPHIHGYQAIRGEKKPQRIKFGKWAFKPIKGCWRLANKPLQQSWLRPILQLYMPAILFLLWVAALVVAIVS